MSVWSCPEAHQSTGSRHLHDSGGKQAGREEHDHRCGGSLLQQRHHSILQSYSGQEASLDLLRLHQPSAVSIPGNILPRVVSIFLIALALV